MTNNIKEFTDLWAYDISYFIKNKGDIRDEDVLNQSIELILSTSFGERFFNPSFGSNFPNRIFDTMDEAFGERLIDDVVKAINKWEDRIIIIEDQVRLRLIPDQHVVYIDIPYVIRRDGRMSRFRKKIII